MPLEDRSTTWLVNRAAYLREKVNALNAIISVIREMQEKHRENFAFVEAAESVIRMIERQVEAISHSLSAIEKEIDRRTVKTAGAGPSHNQ
ncbi:MAG: hypothetical protein QW794_01670 [Thermosphaera sp.]